MNAEEQERLLKATAVLLARLDRLEEMVVGMYDRSDMESHMHQIRAELYADNRGNSSYPQSMESRVADYMKTL